MPLLLDDVQLQDVCSAMDKARSCFMATNTNHSVPGQPGIILGFSLN